MENNVKVRVTVELETNGETEAEELMYLLNMIRSEIQQHKRWKGKIRRVSLIQ
jgi:hypothetical protein